MNIKMRDVSLALLTASVLTMAACASTRDDPTEPPADATAPVDEAATPATDASSVPPPADSTTPATTP